MASPVQPTAGWYKPRKLEGLFIGSKVVDQHLRSCLPSQTSNALIVTGSSLAQTPLIKHLESILTPENHAGTFHDIKQHALISGLDEATALVNQASKPIDTVISVGGGSPIDAAKVISHRHHTKYGRYLTHITIPTTLSAAECTAMAGYTEENGLKVGINDPGIAAAYILYDAQFSLYTPPSLMTSSGIRALDHAVELIYHSSETMLVPRHVSPVAVKELFDLLPRYHADPLNADLICQLHLAAYMSYAFLDFDYQGSLGLSHNLGYALGSPYGISHGSTSCLTLGPVIKLKAGWNPIDAARIASLLPFVGVTASGDNTKDALKFGDLVIALVQDLGLQSTLTEYGVTKDQVDLICARAGASPGKSMSFTENQTQDIRRLIESLY